MAKGFLLGFCRARCVTLTKKWSLQNDFDFERLHFSDVEFWISIEADETHKLRKCHKQLVKHFE